jgi:hypothetical protein
MNKYSFKSILEKEIPLTVEEKEVNIRLYKIEIPKIQRDYAQGRDSAKEIRKRFIDAIFESLSKNELMEMDFVYGAIDEKKNIFTPLDGQQRLTTLFLLYWYIGTRELDKSKRNDLYNYLKKFTYETRISSRRFCENLCKESPETAISFQDKPSEEIMNLPWFFRSYKQDPTIKSMLNMLDAIHKKYMAENKKMFFNLENLQFYILPLNNFNLTDELYVKMNARGKQLTDFENFKADLIKWMKDEKNPYKEIFNKEVELDDRKMNYYFSISLKMDTKWTYFFWQITKNFDITEKYKEGNKRGNLVYPDGKLVDPLFIRLFYRYFLQEFILSSDIDNKNIDKEAAYTALYTSEGKYENFLVFKEILENKDLIKNKEMLEKNNLIKKFELFCDKLIDNWQKIENNISPSWHADAGKKWTFLDRGIEQKDRVVFLAISLFLGQDRPFDKIKFIQWLRVVWNIVENANIINAVSMIGAMRLIEELSRKAAYEIYDFLADEEKKIDSGFSKTVIEEERKKCGFIINKPDEKWEEEFILAERHQFFKGSISFIITEDMTIDEFRRRKEMAFKIFDEKGIREEYRENSHLFLRALISRYTDGKIIGRNFTDTDEDDHYLKNMLASDEVVRNATKEWFLKSEEELKNVLNESIKKDSQIQDKRIRKAHEALYKVPKLQDWMQRTGAIRFDWRYGHLFIFRPNAWYDRVMLDTCRNEIIDYLLKNGFKPENPKSIIDMQIPYFGGYDIEVIGSVDGKDYRITFDYIKTMKIKRKTANGEWEEIKTDDYVEKDIDLNSLFN